MHRTFTVSAVVLLALPLLTGCDKVQARVELKKGNSLYKDEAYSAALKQFQEGLRLDPDATFAWRSVGLTALALYRPGDESPKNVELGKTATDAFEKYLAAYPADKKVRDYLLSTYLAAKRYDDALAYLDRRSQEAPQEAADIQSLKTQIFTQSGRLQEAWQMIQKAPGPGQADALYTIGVSAWDKVYHDATIDNAARTQLVDMGLQSLDQSLKLKPDSFESTVYTNLLYREKAKLQTDPGLRAEYLAKADEWQQKAMVLRNKKLAADKAAAKAAKS